jgi:elongation factor P hydroxylase
MELDITPVLAGLIAAVLPFSLAYAAQVWHKIKHYKPYGAFELEELADRVVRAAEQVFTADEKIEKKAQAWKWMEETAAGYGVKFSAAELDAAIEAAVYRFKQNKAE